MNIQNKEVVNMENRKEVIGGLESLLKMMYDNAPEDRKEELDELKDKLEQIKENEEALENEKSMAGGFLKNKLEQIKENEEKLEKDIDR